MKTIISAREEIHDSAAGHIAALLRARPGAVLALSAGSEMLPVYARLAAMCASGELSMKQARIFALGEYEGAQAHLSCRAVLERALVQPCSVPVENFYVPSAESPGDCDAAIQALGGLDLALVDIGDKGQLAFNEPSTPFASATRVQKLSADARRQRAGYFGGEEKVPERAVTMGIKTITDARDILVIALGSDKSEAVFKMLYGRNDSVIPAAFLQIPLNVKVYLDEEASSKL